MLRSLKQAITLIYLLKLWLLTHDNSIYYGFLFSRDDSIVKNQLSVIISVEWFVSVGRDTDPIIHIYLGRVSEDGYWNWTCRLVVVVQEIIRDASLPHLLEARRCGWEMGRDCYPYDDERPTHPQPTRRFVLEDWPFNPDVLLAHCSSVVVLQYKLPLSSISILVPPKPPPHPRI